MSRPAVPLGTTTNGDEPPGTPDRVFGHDGRVGKGRRPEVPASGNRDAHWAGPVLAVSGPARPGPSRPSCAGQVRSGSSPRRCPCALSQAPEWQKTSPGLASCNRFLGQKWRGEDLSFRPSGYETHFGRPVRISQINGVLLNWPQAGIIRNLLPRAATGCPTAKIESMGFSWDRIREPAALGPWKANTCSSRFPMWRLRQ
jgi:hypothetical protein